jgi:hypothetical protein
MVAEVFRGVLRPIRSIALTSRVIYPAFIVRLDIASISFIPFAYHCLFLMALIYLRNTPFAR